jgi:hypothetical protein
VRYELNSYKSFRRYLFLKGKVNSRFTLQKQIRNCFIKINIPEEFCSLGNELYEHYFAYCPDIYNTLIKTNFE